MVIFIFMKVYYLYKMSCQLIFVGGVEGIKNNIGLEINLVV